jgi:hypothetical protein
MSLLMAGCSLLRPLKEGELIDPLGLRVPSPGAPWGTTRPADSLKASVQDLLHVKQAGFLATVLATGGYGDFNTRWGIPSLLSGGIGPIGSGGTYSGNEMIIIGARGWPAEWAPALITQTELDQISTNVKMELVEVYKSSGMSVTDIKDISSEYKGTFKFWEGYTLAFAYKAGDKDYRVVHVFTMEPYREVWRVYDFSYIRMEKPGAEDHFHDFIAMVKSAKFIRG